MTDKTTVFINDLRKQFTGHSREYYLGYLSAAKYDSCITLQPGWHEKSDEELVELCVQAVINMHQLASDGHKFASESMDEKQFEIEITKLFEMEKSIYDNMVDKKNGTTH